jgi:hypothetical protein
LWTRQEDAAQGKKEGQIDDQVKDQEYKRGNAALVRSIEKQTPV